MAFLNNLPRQIETNVPVGGIILWYGATSTIPENWALCNGENNTPDLRDRFIVGAGSTYNVGALGGNKEIALTEAQMPSHTHTFRGTAHNHTASTSLSGVSTDYTGSHTHTINNMDSGHNSV